MDIYEQIAVKIIASQEAIIGPVAIEQAEQVSGMTINWPDKQVGINGDKVGAVETLIGHYKELFGQISVEVSKQAAETLLTQLPAEAVPASLQ